MKNLDKFPFNKNLKISDAFTFDDIFLVPQYSEILPSDVSLRSFFARDVFLYSPILSAAMDTVTEHKMAQVVAQHGGVGIIHKNLSVAEQVAQVDRVKKYESGMILDPVTLSPEHSLEDATKLMKHYGFSGVPITVNDKLVGILTNRDLRFENNLSRKIKDLMTSKNLITTKVGTTLEDAKGILHKHRIEKLPVVDKDGGLRGLITIKDIEKSETFPHASKDSRGRLLVGAAVGAKDYDRIAALVEAEVDILSIDSAHGHSKNVLNCVEYIHKNHPDTIIIAGNVVTAEGTKTLIQKGADVVKVGVGAGSICTTRMISGVGVPQVSAVYECAQEAKKHNKSIISDGGIKYSGDITKSLAIGANAVMIGSILAGTDESPGEIILYQGRSYKTYRGMGSLGAMRKGDRSRYSQDHIQSVQKLVPEGIEGRVPYKGKVGDALYQLLGGVRSGMGYVGAESIEVLQACKEYVRISAASIKESHVHNVMVTKEAPNYRLD